MSKKNNTRTYTMPEIISELMHEQRINQTELAKRIGMTPGGVCNAIKDAKPKSNTTLKILKALGATVSMNVTVRGGGQVYKMQPINHK